MANFLKDFSVSSEHFIALFTIHQRSLVPHRNTAKIDAFILSLIDENEENSLPPSHNVVV